MFKPWHYLKFRERFNSGNEKATPESRKNQRNDHKNTTNDVSPTTSTSSTATKEVETKTKTKTTTTNKKQEPQPKPEPITPNQSTQHSTTTSCKDVLHKAKFVDSFSSPIAQKEDRHYKDDNKYDFIEDEGQFMSAKASNSGGRDRGMQAFESFHDWMTNSEYSQTRSDLDEDESYDMQLFDTEYDWISEISRPKKDWEDMRQARYEEMLHHPSGNTDIQRLLERQVILSTFLIDHNINKSYQTIYIYC